MLFSTLSRIPRFLVTDAYKASHFLMYPDVAEMYAYSEFRKSFNNDPTDRRIIFFGLRHLVENFLTTPWTTEELEIAEKFWSTFHAGNSEYVFPKELFEKFIKENDGYFPIKFCALPEGSVVYPHVPLFTFEADSEYSKLATYLETIFTTVWYPSTVATLSRRVKDIIEHAFNASVDGESFWRLESQLHDFGFRGCTTLEQSMLGGAAHLLNFRGTDTLSAAYYVQFELNNGVPVGNSIPASEHSVMTSWPSETDAIKKILEEFGDKIVSIVMDSYNYLNALRNILPCIKAMKLEKGGILVLRPDSGDPVQSVMQGLRAAERVFGVSVNEKGYKVLDKCGIIQGDGIGPELIEKILKSVLQAGFSAQNVVFGMGGALLQKVNRDTMSFATKLSYVKYDDGSERDVAKKPESSKEKRSLAGRFIVLGEEGKPVVYPYNRDILSENRLQLVYDGREEDCRKFKWESFDVIRNRVETEWKNAPKLHNPISMELDAKIKAI